MLKRFKINGFKNFYKEFILDFSNPGSYQFNEKAVHMGTVKNAVMYGKNASGKSNLGLALFDIISTLTDNNSGVDHYDYFLNRDVKTETATFVYEFSFGTDQVIYSYSKNERREILEEKLVINNEEVMNANNIKGPTSSFQILSPTLVINNFIGYKQYSSLLKFIYANSVFEDDNVINKLFQFVDGMLWYVADGKDYRFIGLQDNANNFYSFIQDEDRLSDFERLLHHSGINKKLIILQDNDGKETIYVDGDVPYHFLKTASKGTRDLYYFFYWTTRPNISFLFIDEFDSFFHFELAKKILEDLINRSYQSMVTTHNVMLLSNEILRPDCYFIIDSESIYNINSKDLNNNELRRGHNLSSMYVKGLFENHEE